MNIIGSYEKHPYLSFNNKDIEYLIIGSFPPIRLTNKFICNDSLGELYEDYPRTFDEEEDLKFYYGSRDNLFWKLISEISGKELTNIIQITNFLTENKIGITDLYEHCSRKIINDRINSNDNNLVILKRRELSDIFEKCSSLHTLIFTSKWVNQRFEEYYSILSEYSIIILESPSKSYSRFIGRLPAYQGQRLNNPNYNTYMYRLEKYGEELSFIVCNEMKRVHNKKRIINEHLPNP